MARAERRSWGKRAAKRRVVELREQFLALRDEGRSVPTIASCMGLSQAGIRELLEAAAEDEEEGEEVA